jgi:hypothetical protein
MRTYQLMPGKLLEWEGAWRRGLEARKRFVVSGPSQWLEHSSQRAHGSVYMTDSNSNLSVHSSASSGNCMRVSLEIRADDSKSK